MNILKVSCLKGPNYWSNNRKKLMVFKIDLENYEFSPTNHIPHFNEALQTLLPSLYEHRCSPGVPGGFFKRLHEGTWLGHVMEHVALELQWLAGMHCGFGRTFGTDQEGVYQVIFSYEYEEAGYYAGHAAFALVSALAEGKPYPQYEEDIRVLRQIAAKEHYGPSTAALVNEAKARDIPVQRIADSLIRLGYGCKQKKIWTSVTQESSAIGMDIAADKELTKKLLAAACLPVPEGETVTSERELEKLLKTMEFPLVTKPKDGNHGRGITMPIRGKEQLYTGFHAAREIAPAVLVERFIQGEDYRFLVVNYQFVAAAKRTPALIIGDGIHTIRGLIDELNKDPRRGPNHDNFLTQIVCDRTTENLLLEQGLNYDSILPAGIHAYLKHTANLSSGGTATDVTAQIPKDTIQLIERAARVIGLDVCGIDVVAKDISLPLTADNGAILEVNAGPGLRMHLSPNAGTPRNVAKPILDMLFPGQDNGKIPIVGVTGTNGKTTVTTLLARLMQKNGQVVGYTTTNGIYLNEHLLHQGDCSGPLSAQVILNDPAVEVAVLECARGGILRAGLGFDACDISIITNITGDHLGLNDINTLGELARVKGVLARSTHKNGYALLNAEDDLCYGLKEELDCRVALFSRTKNERILAHCHTGGIAIYVHQNKLTLQEHHSIIELASITDIPLTYHGSARCMVLNILPVVLAAHLSQVSIATITEFLTQTKLTPEILPGRMNLFSFPNCKIMIDYAHNEGAYKELQHYLATLSYDKCIGIMGVPGDRRDEDIIKLGTLAAQLFDEIIIRHDKDQRLRSNEEITALLIKGINAFQERKIHIISEQNEALNYALQRVESNSFIFYDVDNVFQAVDYVSELQNQVQAAFRKAAVFAEAAI